jgi:histidine triad (HIT) family protein
LAGILPISLVAHPKVVQRDARRRTITAMPDAAEDCLFCRIVAGDIPATVVSETDATLAFRDVNPQAPVHVLVIPKRHVRDVAELAEDADLLAAVGRHTSAVARAEGLGETGYRVVFNTGAGAGQTVFHAHAHVLGGRGMTWPPG